MVYRIINASEIPEGIRKVVQEIKKEENFVVYQEQRKAYIIITRGEKKTGGYSVHISDIDRIISNEDKPAIWVKASYRDPQDGQAVIQSITYPYTIAEIDLEDILTDMSFELYIDGIKKHKNIIDINNNKKDWQQNIK